MLPSRHDFHERAMELVRDHDPRTFARIIEDDGQVVSLEDRPRKAWRKETYTEVIVRISEELRVEAITSAVKRKLTGS